MTDTTDNNSGKSSFRKWITIIPVVLLLLFVMLFVIKNMHAVKIAYVFGSREVALSFLLVLFFLLGFLLGMLFLARNVWRARRFRKDKEKEIATLEDRLKFVQDKLDESSE